MKYRIVISNNPVQPKFTTSNNQTSRKYKGESKKIDSPLLIGIVTKTNLPYIY